MKSASARRQGTSARQRRLKSKRASRFPVRVTMDTTFGDLMKIPGSQPILQPVMGGMMAQFGGVPKDDSMSGMMNAMVGFMPLHALKSFGGGQVSDKMLEEMIAALNRIQE